MSDWIDLFPELDTDIFAELIKNTRPIKEFGADAVGLMTRLVFKKLAGGFGGYHHFWSDEDGKDSAIDGWALLISQLSARQVFNGLSQILNGKAVNEKGEVYSDYPPKAAVAFRTICLSAPSLFSQPKQVIDAPQITYDIGSAEQRNINLMREFVSNFRMNGAKKNHESCEFHEEYDKLCEQRNMNKVCECGTTYYTDKACPECGMRDRSYKPPEEIRNKTQWGGY